MLSFSQKMQAVHDATSVNIDGEVPHPRRRFITASFPGDNYRTWHIFDRLQDRPLSRPEVDQLTLDDLLQEFPERSQ